MTDSRERATGPNGVGRSGRGGKVNDLSAAMKGGGGGSSTTAVAEVIVTPDTATLVVGETRRFTAQARDASGRAIPASQAPMAWGIANPALCSRPVRLGTATVEVTALAAGTVALDATAENVTGTATIVVTAAPIVPTPTPVSALSVSHATRAFAVTVGAANPAPQAVTWSNPAGLTGLVVALTTEAPWLSLDTVAGVTTFTVTTPATTEGSPLTATVTGTQAGASGSPVSVTVSVTVSAAPDPAPPPDADVALYGAPIQLATETAALGGAFATYDTMFPAAADQHWTAEGARWEGDYYDRALVYYAMWARTGNATWRERADAQAVGYRDGYLVPAVGGSSPHWAQLEGLYIHYRLTGDDASRLAVVRTAESLWTGLALAIYRGDGTDMRVEARTLQAQLLAHRLGGHPDVTPTTIWPNASLSNPGHTFADRIDYLLDRTLTLEGPDGAYRVPVYCNEQANFTVGLLLTQLIQVHVHYAATPRRAALLAQVQRGVAFLWISQWHSDAAAFQYLSGGCAGVGGTEMAGDLTGLLVEAWGWLAAETGDPTYRTQGDAIWSGMVAGANLAGSKQFNQLYSTSWRYLGWRAASL